MSDLTIGQPDGTTAVFRPLMVALILLIGIAGFAGMLLLGAYAPGWRSNNDGGPHALSNAAIGYSGLVRLIDRTGRHPRIIRNAHLWDSEDLLVATPPSGSVDVSGIVARRVGRPTLMILPKWAAIEDPARSGWVWVSLLPTREPEGVLAPGWKLDVTRRAGQRGRPLVTEQDLPGGLHFSAPPRLQVITGIAGGMIKPLITDGKGGIVLGQLDGRPFYVLADPDLLDNAGMKDPAGAASALALLDWMNSTAARSIGFDVTLDGIPRGRSPLKLALEPPFLAVSLAILATLLLVGLYGLARFGAPLPRDRAIAFGKAALVDNSAILVAKAGLTHRMGGRYAAVMRERAAQAFGISVRIKGDALDAQLDAARPDRPFTRLAVATEQAQDKAHLLATAQALHAWQQERRG